MIELSNIYLKNWMSIEELSLTFEKNSIVAITGENGAGKSALLYAIAFTLTGFRKGESYKDYIRVGEEKAEIFLEGYLKGNIIKYEIEIISNKKVTNTKRKVTYKNEVYLNSDYNQFVKEHDLNLLENIMFLFQGNTEIVNSKPAERAHLLKKMFPTDFSSIIDNFKEKLETLNTKSIELNAILNDLSNKSFEKLPLQRTLTPSAIEIKKKKLQTLEEEISSIKNVDAKNFTKYENWLNDIDKNISKENTRIESSKKQIDKLQNSLIEIEEPNVENPNIIKESLEEQNLILKEITKKLNNSNEEVKLQNHVCTELKNQLAICRTGVCHACGHDISPEHTENLERKLKENETLLDNLLTENEAIKEEKKKQQKEVSSLEKTLESIKDILDRYERNKNKNINTLQSIAFYEKDIETSKSTLNRLLEDREHVLIEKETVDKLKPIYEKKQDLLKAQQTLKNEISIAEKNIIINMERTQHNENIVREKEERDLRVKTLSEEYNNTLLSISNVKQCINVFDVSFPNYIIIRACEKLEGFINGIIYKVFPNMRVSLELSRSGVTFMYTLEGDEPIPVSMASGAQKTILALAYQIALAKMYGLSCIFLDEADAAMSDDNAKQVYEFILSLEDFTQIFFISHRKESLEVIDNTVRDNVINYYVKEGLYLEK